MVFATAARHDQTLAHRQSAVGAAVFEFPSRGVTLHWFEAFFRQLGFCHRPLPGKPDGRCARGSAGDRRRLRAGCLRNLGHGGSALGWGGL